MTTEVVRVYTKPNCKQCDLTKNLLTKHGIAYEIEDMLDPENVAAALALGYLSAPVVIVGQDGWAGFRPDKIGELAARLGDND